MKILVDAYQFFRLYKKMHPVIRRADYAQWGIEARVNPVGAHEILVKLRTPFFYAEIKLPGQVIEPGSFVSADTAAFVGLNAGVTNIDRWKKNPSRVLISYDSAAEIFSAAEKGLRENLTLYSGKMLESIMQPLPRHSDFFYHFKIEARTLKQMLADINSFIMAVPPDDHYFSRAVTISINEQPAGDDWIYCVRPTTLLRYPLKVKYFAEEQRSLKLTLYAVPFLDMHDVFSSGLLSASDEYTVYSDNDDENLVFKSPEALFMVSRSSVPHERLFEYIQEQEGDAVMKLHMPANTAISDLKNVVAAFGPKSFARLFLSVSTLDGQLTAFGIARGQKLSTFVWKPDAGHGIPKHSWAAYVNAREVLNAVKAVSTFSAVVVIKHIGGRAPLVVTGPGLLTPTVYTSIIL